MKVLSNKLFTFNLKLTESALFLPTNILYENPASTKPKEGNCKDPLLTSLEKLAGEIFAYNLSV